MGHLVLLATPMKRAFASIELIYYAFSLVKFFTTGAPHLIVKRIALTQRPQLFAQCRCLEQHFLRIPWLKMHCLFMYATNWQAPRLNGVLRAAVAARHNIHVTPGSRRCTMFVARKSRRQ